MKDIGGGIGYIYLHFIKNERIMKDNILKFSGWLLLTAIFLPLYAQKIIWFWQTPVLHLKDCWKFQPLPFAVRTR